MLPPSFQGPGCACVRPVPIVFVGVAVVAVAAFLLRIRGRSGFGDRPRLPVAILVVAKPIPHVRLELVLAWKIYFFNLKECCHNKLSTKGGHKAGKGQK